MHKHQGCQDCEQLEGHYANYLMVGHNVLEFLLDFGQRYADSQAGPIHTRIITSPVYAKAFLATLQGSIRQYEAEHGTIPQHTQAEDGG